MKKFSFDFFSRKKTFTDDSLVDTNFQRILKLLDVTAIGIGSTLGSGVYILSGTVIRNYSGPATLISFIIAGIATFLSGLSYAELGSRVPRSGSAFVYIYVTIGEFFAFMMGWDLILELHKIYNLNFKIMKFSVYIINGTLKFYRYIIGTSSTANALSQYIDSLTGKQISMFFARHLAMHASGLGEYVDLLAFVIAIVVTSSFFKLFLMIIIIFNSKANNSFKF